MYLVYLIYHVVLLCCKQWIPGFVYLQSVIIACPRMVVFFLTSLYAFLFSGNLLRKARDGTCTTMYGGHDKKTFRQGLLVITGVLATAWHVYL